MDSPTRLAYLQGKKDEYARNRDKYLARVKVNNQRRVRFQTKRVYVKDQPRTGICSLCRAQERTVLHHIQYDERDVLAYTVELCQSCHSKTHGGESN